MPSIVLVTSSGNKAPLVRALQIATREVLPSHVVMAGDSDETAPTQYVADGFWPMPPTRDEFLNEIVHGLRRRQVGIVLPTRDGELMFWANHADRLAQEGIQVIVSKPDSLQRCLDKLEFARFGAANGLPFIPTREHFDDVRSGRWVVKERFGAGSRSIGLQLDCADAIAHAAKLESPVFQPYIDGQEVSVDAWLDRQHQLKGLILRRRDCVVNGESQVTTTFSDARLEEQATAILQSLKLIGPVVMQVLVGADGGVHVIECNPRFGGASTLGIAAGLTSLHWSLLEAAGAELVSWPFRRIEGQIRQIRLPSDIYVTNPNF